MTEAELRERLWEEYEKRSTDIGKMNLIDTLRDLATLMDDALFYKMIHDEDHYA